MQLHALSHWRECSTSSTTAIASRQDKYTPIPRAGHAGPQWQQVDLTRQLAWVHPDQAKPRRISVPLNGEAMAVVRKQVGKHPTCVFGYKADYPSQYQGFYAALDRAGIVDFRWHDLRHVWATWHVQNGTPLFAFQELGGWEGPEMARHYAHLAADHLAP